MSLVIDDLAQYLALNGVGTLGVNLFEAFFPPNPDSATASLETGGTKPEIDIPLYSPSFQVLVRSTAYDLGRTQCDLIRSLLHNQYNKQFVVGGIYFYFTRLIADGGHIGQDATGRDIWSMNFECLRR
jgi:hypothetical protein